MTLKVKLIAGFVLVCCTIFKCTGTFAEDYCWRDYDGVIPSDALIAGLDRQKRPTYIGQTLFNDKIIPGNIYENESEIHFEFGKAHTATQNIKILCSHFPERFEWIQTSNTKVIDLTDKHIFVAGYEAKYITYVGRATTHDEVTVGKVVCHASGCYELTTIYDDQWYPHYEFEILTYNPNVRRLEQDNPTPEDVTKSTAPPCCNNDYDDPLTTYASSTVNDLAETEFRDSSKSTLPEFIVLLLPILIVFIC